MRHSIKNYDDAIAAQWRSWANSEVVYTEDFTSALLTGTELPDNSLAKGATKIEWIFDITNPRAAKFITRDNASGIENQRSLLRFCKIGSKESSSAYNQYGQGRICALTTLMPIYEAAEWTATFKHCGNPKSLSQISHPWRSSDEMQSSMTEIPIDATNCDLGFEWDITFDTSILGEELASDPRKLFAKTKERLTTKYSKSVFDKTEFVLTVKNTTQTITESSRTNKWKTLRQMFEELPASCVKTIYDETFMWKSIQVRVTEYLLLTFPKTKEPAALVALRTAFPTFGTKCENSQRVHISNDGRLIESRPKPEMEGRKLDNHQNGEVVFIDTDSTCAGGDFNDQPTPCTIKVSIKKECENLKGIYKMYRDEKKRRAEEEKIEKAARAAKERADKATKAAMEKAAKDAAAREAIAKAARESLAKKLAKSLRRMEVAGGGGEAQQQQQQASQQAPQQASQQASQHSDDGEPGSPSMPELYTIPTFPTLPSHVVVPLASLATLASPSPSPAPIPAPAPLALPKSHFTAEDMKEVLRMSLTHITSADAQAILKTQFMEKYGFDTQ